jgi:lipopolysaccharide transport system ATP-binding protein
MLFGGKGKKYYREFWALRNIDFEISPGETVGIIGRNGSGKSTLLQIICGTLTPTNGLVQTDGRIAALLELGSGFNPEFTGRENVYLNASVLGLTREETDARFDDIVSFADIGEFIDQPTKTYSSGMMVRLAFAVIAHVDANILVIDEALAVGDAIFTQKCMRFIRKFQTNGTLLFVSHDMSSVLNLCQSGIWLNQGTILEQGQSKTVSEAYLQFTHQEIYGDEVLLVPTNNENVKSKDLQEQEDIAPYQADFSVENNLTNASGWKTGAAEIISITLKSQDGNDNLLLKGGDVVTLEVITMVHKKLDRPVIGFLFKDRLGQDLFGENTLSLTEINQLSVSSGEKLCANFTFKLPMLPNGAYSITCTVADGDLQSHIQHHFLHDALIVNISSSKVRWGLVGISFSNINFQVIK